LIKNIKVNAAGKQLNWLVSFYRLTLESKKSSSRFFSREDFQQGATACHPVH
jgi:hypothetical protein